MKLFVYSSGLNTCLVAVALAALDRSGEAQVCWTENVISASADGAQFVLAADVEVERTRPGLRVAVDVSVDVVDSRQAGEDVVRLLGLRMIMRSGTTTRGNDDAGQAVRLGSTVFR